MLRTGKVSKESGDERGMWNYARLCFNTKYPWESTPVNKAEPTPSLNAELAPAPIVEAQQYVLHDVTTGDCLKANIILWNGNKDGVLYRRQYFNYSTSRSLTWTQGLELADFVVPYGIVRVDKLRLHRRPITMTLGSYGFPDNGTEVILACKNNAKANENNAKAIILKGHDHMGNERQLAMTLYDGFDGIDVVHSEGTNPDSKESIIIYGKLSRHKQYGYEPYIMVSQVITKESLEDFKDEEIFPIKSITYTDKEGCGGYGPVYVELKDGSRKVVDFYGMEGRLGY